MVPAASHATDYQGTPDTYRTLVPMLRAGDTLHLASGTYSHLLDVSGLDGTADAPITITGPDTGAAAIFVADPTPCCNTIEIRNSSYIVLRALTVDGAHVDGAFGVSAGGGASNRVHHVTIEGCTFVNHDGSQQHDAISTKTPTWGWIIRGNRILGAGTGMYLGNSDGSSPFIAGLIENNLVENPIGYCMEIKFQQPWPAIPGIPTEATSTIIRNNVFIKNDAPSPDGDRPNVLVGGFPDTGAGANSRYEIYGNVFFHNPRESLFQGSGRLSLHDNLFVDVAGTAILLRDHDLPLEQAFVYDNTIYTAGTGIRFASAAPQGDLVAGNLVFAATPITGTIAMQHDNVTDTTANAGLYVNSPSTTLATLDLYPRTGSAARGAPFDPSVRGADDDFDRDFDCRPRGANVYRGAYAGEGTNPGWHVAADVKPPGMCTSSESDGGVLGDAETVDAIVRDVGASRDASPFDAADGGAASMHAGCTCRVAERSRKSDAPPAVACSSLVAFAATVRAARRRARRHRRT
jgi:hypothetical protein